MEMNINEVKNFLPHRYPFLLIDRVIRFESGKNLTAIKNVSDSNLITRSISKKGYR
jgi:3-hydroxyacyl-[acyl-carrier-protein] dehydratase